MKNTLAFQAYSQKENLTLELCFSLRAPCKEKTSELWSFEREEALKKKKSSRERCKWGKMSLGKLEELSDVVMKGCQWRWWQLKCITQGCCSNRNRCYSPTCLQTQGLWLRVSCQRKSRENRANGCIVHREPSLLIVLFIEIQEKTQKSEKCLLQRLPLAVVFEMRWRALCVG